MDELDNFWAGTTTHSVIWGFSVDGNSSQLAEIALDLLSQCAPESSLGLWCQTIAGSLKRDVLENYFRDRSDELCFGCDAQSLDELIKEAVLRTDELSHRGLPFKIVFCPNGLVMANDHSFGDGAFSLLLLQSFVAMAMPSLRLEASIGDLPRCANRVADLVSAIFRQWRSAPREALKCILALIERSGSVGQRVPVREGFRGFAPPYSLVGTISADEIESVRLWCRARSTPVSVSSALLWGFLQCGQEHGLQTKVSPWSILASLRSGSKRLSQSRGVLLGSIVVRPEDMRGLEELNSRIRSTIGSGELLLLHLLKYFKVGAARLLGGRLGVQSLDSRGASHRDAFCFSWSDRGRFSDWRLPGVESLPDSDLRDTILISFARPVGTSISVNVNWLNGSACLCLTVNDDDRIKRPVVEGMLRAFCKDPILYVSS